MSTRVLFLVMSAVHSAAAVDQLASALAPNQVLVHHDFSQTPEFELKSANAAFVPNPVRTGWSDWGFSEAIFHSVRHALDHLDFDYLKLLSPSCLPIKPVREFEDYLEAGRIEAAYECVDVFENREALMTVGYRALAGRETLWYRLLHKLSRAYFGPDPVTRDLAGIQLYVEGAREARVSGALAARIADAALRFARSRVRRMAPFSGGFPLCIGGTWFGARRATLREMLEVFDRRDVRDYFCSLFGADEFLIPSVLHHLSPRQGPLLHFVSTFTGARPNWLCDEDFGMLRDSDAFFARKFPDDVSAPLRLKVLRELAGCRVAA